MRLISAPTKNEIAASGMKADLAIVGEPTGLRVVTAHKGDLWLRIETRGKSAHGARPELGRNAVHAMAQIVDLLERKVITRELFDEKSIAEVLDPDNLKRRYCLCRNPETAKRETRTRKELLEVTRQKLEAIAAPRKNPAQKQPDQ